MEKKFCPKCGNKTLKRVSVTVDSEGKQQVFTSPTSKPSLDRFIHKKNPGRFTSARGVSWHQRGSGSPYQLQKYKLSQYLKNYLSFCLKGGKHSVNPRLVEDQREAQQRLSKKALLATNPTQVNLGECKAEAKNDCCPFSGWVCSRQFSFLHKRCHKQVSNAGIAGPGLPFSTIHVDCL